MSTSLQPTDGTALALKKPHPSRIGWFRHSSGIFLGALVLMFIAFPFILDLQYGDLIQTMLLGSVLTSAVFAVGGRRKSLIIALSLIVPTIFCKWMNRMWPDVMPAQVFLGLGVGFLGYIIFQLMRFILRAPRVNSEVMCASVSCYLLLGLMWAFLYLIVARSTHGAFVYNAGPVDEHPMDGFTAFYFSFITLCTIGYGDITPASKVVRMLAVMEGITGTFYVAILIARLMSLYMAPAAKVDESAPWE
jgi:hypothetical protein